MNHLSPKELDFTKLASALGIDHVRVIDPYDIKTTRRVLKEELVKRASVVISQRACVLFKREMKGVQKTFKVDIDKCVGCKACIGLGCPAISWIKFENMPSKKVRSSVKKQEGVAFIDNELCTGCTLCEQVCNVGAVIEVV